MIWIAIIAGVLFYGYKEFTGTGPLAEGKTVLIKKGSSLNSIAVMLENEGVISSAMIFKVAGRIMAVANEVKSGEYEFEAGISQTGVLDKIVQGRTVIHKVTVPEGYTSKEVVDILDSIGILVGDAGNIEEGSLLANTYYYSYGDTRKEVIRRMQDAFDVQIEAMWRERDAGLPFKTKEEAVVLASIVEKETGIPSERKDVASVFINRLNKGMRLQSDPTVIYGLKLDRKLKADDLKIKNPYNTYKISGLPPKPICNVGFDALNAVLHPNKTGYLYFVADGSGGHVFSNDFKSHGKNVKNWREFRKRQQQAQDDLNIEIDLQGLEP